MPRRKSTEKAEDTEINISGTVGAATPESKSTSLKGKKITLNQKNETFFGVGKIWLSPKSYTTTVPKNISDDELNILVRGLKDGKIKLGDDYISPIERDEKVLEEYWDLIKQFGLNHQDEKSESMMAFRGIFKKGVDRNWTAKEIANFCIDRESKGKNREKVIKLLNDIRKYSDCPDTLLER